MPLSSVAFVLSPMVLLVLLVQITRVNTAWGAMLGHALGTGQDLVDVYLRQLQLYEEHDPSKQRIKIYQPQLDPPTPEQPQ